MSFLSITIPATLLLAGVLLVLVIRSVRRGELDDMEGPAERHAFDDDRCPERERGSETAETRSVQASSRWVPEQVARQRRAP
jgi:cbb3-type cytochrome oxidase maturation protein